MAKKPRSSERNWSEAEARRVLVACEEAQLAHVAGEGELVETS